MSFKRKAAVLSSILVVLAVMYLLGSIFNRESAYEQLLNTPVFGDFAPEGVWRIFLYSPGDSSRQPDRIVLDRRGGELWSVEIRGDAYPADSGRITDFLNKAEQLLKISMVSKRPERLEDFGLTDAEAYGLAFYGVNGEKEYECYFGKTGINADEQYIRYPDSDEVYIAAGTLDFFLGRGTAFWSDLRIIPQTIDRESVERLQVDDPRTAESEETEGSGLDYTLLRRPGGDAPEWGIAGREDVPVQYQRVERLINELLTLRAHRFVTPDERASGIGEMLVTLSLVLNNGSRSLIRVFASAEEDEYYVEAEGLGSYFTNDERPFTLALMEYQYDQIVIEAEQLYESTSRDAGF